MDTDFDKLLQDITAFEIDDVDAGFSFSNRLARDNGWPLEYALHAIEEYKKFIFLLCKFNQPLTPSDQVDQVWHLHLIYTESYWTEFCEHTLKRKIHHGPTKGGTEERGKFTNWYAETKRLYFNEFKCKPPEDIWPNDKIRFGEINFERVNRHRNWVIPKIKLFNK